MTPWSRLQALSCEHANRLHATGTCHGTIGRRRQIGVPEVIKENVEILGRADDAEMKNRTFWYITFHPAIFQACAKVWNDPAANTWCGIIDSRNGLRKLRRDDAA